MTLAAIAVFDPRINHGIGGTIRFHSIRSHTVRITFDLHGFQPHAIHAIHIHEFGDVSQGCASLGAHFNPTRVPHGHGFHGHAGDLFNNLQAGEDGRYVLQFDSPLLSLDPTSPACVLGRSVVIHAYPDDLGNAEMYPQWSTAQLQDRASTLGYNVGRSRSALLHKFQNESKTTGNASTRLACAVIGWATSTPATDAKS